MQEFDTQADKASEEEKEQDRARRRGAAPVEASGASFAAQGVPPWDPLSGEASPFSKALFDPLSGEEQPRDALDAGDPVTTFSPIQKRSATWDPPPAVMRAQGGGLSAQLQTLFDEDVHETAQKGVSGSGAPLPHKEQIQRSFGAEHDLSSVRAHVGGAAGEAAQRIGARAYTTGDDIAFESSPDLRLAAHEAAHVVQQRSGVSLSGGVGEQGDPYERHADAVADRVVRGESAADLLAAAGPAGPSSAAPAGGLGVQLALADDLRSRSAARPVDSQQIVDLIAAAPLDEVTAVANNTTLIRQVEARMPQATRDQLRARLARRLFIDGNRPIEAWALITGNDRLRRQRYLDAYGTVAEQRAFCDAVINDGSNVGYVIRAFDSYWNVEASAERGLVWNAEILQRVHAHCKLLPEQDVRSGAWRQMALGGGRGASMSGGSVSDADWQGRFTIGVGASYAGQRGTLSRAARAGATQIFVSNPQAFRKDDRITIGDFHTSPDSPTIKDVNNAIRRFKIEPGLSTAYPAGTPYTTVQTDGRSTELAQPAPIGATQLVVADSTPFTTLVAVSLGPYPSRDVKRVSHIDHATKTLTLSSPIVAAYDTGARVSPTTAVVYGVGTATTTDAAKDATEITVADPSLFQAGDTIALGPRPSADVKQIRAVDLPTKKYTLDSGLSKDYETGTAVGRNDQMGLRNVDWVGAAVRHEIGHAVDALIGATGFYALGDFTSDADFDAWAAAMGNPWQTNDGTTISAADRGAIKQHIVQAKDRNTPRELNHGLSPRHAVNRYWTKDVPVIEAAKPCIRAGQRFWTTPENFKKYGSKYFTINTYYGTFQSHNEQAHTQRVRSYQLFAPAEFFAEMYTVFYEESGQVADADLGRLVPVAGWREWIRTNVHERNQGPAQVQQQGGAPSPSVGAQAHNPGTR